MACWCTACVSYHIRICWSLVVAQKEHVTPGHSILSCIAWSMYCVWPPGSIGSSASAILPIHQYHLHMSHSCVSAPRLMCPTCSLCFVMVVNPVNKRVLCRICCYYEGFIWIAGWFRSFLTYGASTSAFASLPSAWVMACGTSACASVSWAEVLMMLGCDI